VGEGVKKFVKNVRQVEAVLVGSLPALAAEMVACFQRSRAVGALVDGWEEEWGRDFSGAQDTGSSGLEKEGRCLSKG